MIFQQQLNQLKVVKRDIIEMIDLFQNIPNDDPQKFDFYNNILAILDMEIARESENKVKFRLLNNYGSGQINLAQLSNTASHIQAAYTSAFGKQVGIIDGRNKYYSKLIDSSKIIASMEAGSFIISVDKIGDDLKSSEMDLLIDEVEREELLASLVLEVGNLDGGDSESIELFIEEYGYKSLKHFETWFQTLIEDDVSFEVYNKYNWKKSFSKPEIFNIYNKIHSISYSEQKDYLRLCGELLTIDAIKNRLVLRDIKLGDVEIRMPKGILQSKSIGEKVKIHRQYNIDVIKHTISYPSKKRIVFNFENWDIV